MGYFLLTCAFLAIIAAVGLICYNKGFNDGRTQTRASFECPPGEAGEVAKIIYPNGTVKCPDYNKKILRFQKIKGATK